MITDGVVEDVQDQVVATVEGLQRSKSIKVCHRPAAKWELTVCACLSVHAVTEREREREIERERERHTHTQTQTHRHRHTDTDTHKHTHTHTHALSRAPRLPDLPRVCPHEREQCKECTRSRRQPDACAPPAHRTCDGRALSLVRRRFRGSAVAVDRAVCGGV